MQPYQSAKQSLGDTPPIIAGGRKGPPDRRGVSVRWLGGTFLTGVCSTIMMGSALFVALDSGAGISSPQPGRALASGYDSDALSVRRGERLLEAPVLARASDREIIRVSTMVKQNDRDIVRTRPFANVKINLGVAHATSKSYPDFNPLMMFAENGADTSPEMPTGSLYGAEVESEISLRHSAFPVSATFFGAQDDLPADEVEKLVRVASGYTVPVEGNAMQMASLYPSAAGEFDLSPSPDGLSDPVSVRILEENRSIAKQFVASAESVYAESVLAVREVRTLSSVLLEQKVDAEQAVKVAEVLSEALGSDTLRAGHVLRIGMKLKGETGQIIRASIYDVGDHVATVALNDRQDFVSSPAPEISPAVTAAFTGAPARIAPRGDLPKIYDGLWKAGLAYDMTPKMLERTMQMLASDIDFQQRLSAEDRLEVLFSLNDETEEADERSEIVFVNASIGQNNLRYYRFRDPETGIAEYYDGEGRSARQFLLRNPVPTGKFRSGFGMRKHPILRYRRMHSGVDWSAPRGTPILAAGSGVVEKAGWNSGNGQHTVIRHANGYESSYSHQSAIHKSVKPGSRIRQGQIIGYVGSTGLSTGNHLHYELSVNGTKVDPMRVRLPEGHTLSDEALAKFQKERDRIDVLLEGKKGPLLASR